MKYNEVSGDLISLAKEGNFDAISHGCNCFCKMKKGIALSMAKNFGCDQERGLFKLEAKEREGDIEKLGNIEYKNINISPGRYVTVINSYTQHKIKQFNDAEYYYTTPDNPFDYEAFALCMRKINKVFKGKHIGLPKIGSDLAGGDWEKIKTIIQKELKDCKITVVIYNL